ncbi:hypothetical protein SEA_STUFF_70 [Streptomyces phage Stuff]|nr:hypothetical protein SEA_STUFF_70 [Streptomyces phage Stuff]
MSTRTTIADLRRVVEQRYIPQLQALGVPTDGITLERGTGLYTLKDADGFPAPGVVGHGMESAYIGNTAAEAYTTVQTIAKALEFAGAFMVANPERVLR